MTILHKKVKEFGEAPLSPPSVEEVGPVDTPLPQDAQPPNFLIESQQPREPSISEREPDTSQELVSEWKVWQQRVSEAIFIRFDNVAHRAFANSRPLSCEAAYTVTHDRQIINVKLLKKSNNIVYNSMLLMVLKSMNGNPLLEFPPGSKREFMGKTGVFAVHESVTKDGTICDPPMEQLITPTKSR